MQSPEMIDYLRAVMREFGQKTLPAQLPGDVTDLIFKYLMRDDPNGANEETFESTSAFGEALKMREVSKPLAPITTTTTTTTTTSTAASGHGSSGTGGEVKLQDKHQAKK